MRLVIYPGSLLRKDLMHTLANYRKYVASSSNEMQTMNTRAFSFLKDVHAHATDLVTCMEFALFWVHL